MREILTILAGLLALVLTAAFVGPYVVDWTAHRAWVEAQLSEAVGADVSVEGAIDIKLLPTPRLSIERVRIGSGTPGAPSMTAAAMRLELSPSPLMRGELRVTDADVESPAIRATLGPDGALSLPDMGSTPADRVVIDHLRIINGSVVISEPSRDRSLVVAGVELDVEAASLIGPFKGAGRFGEADAATSFRFTTGAHEAGRLRLKLILDETPRTPRMDFDGALLLPAGSAGSTKPGFAGPATFSGSLRGVPWRATGALTADASAADLKNLELRAGPEDKALNVAGAARLELGLQPQLRLDLTARQIDIDRLFGEDGAAPQRFGDAVANLVNAPGARAPLPVAINLTSPALTLGGETLSDLSAAIVVRDGAQATVRIEANGPGRSHLLLDGAVETGLAAKFSGRIDSSVRNMSRFEDWLSSISAELAGRLRNLPVRALDVAGQVDVSGAGFAGRGLAIKADRSSFAGAVAFTRAIGDERARLFADLTSPALDLDGVPDLTGPASAAAGVDMSVSLEARAIRLARFGEGIIDAGRINVKFARTGDELRLQNFAIANLGGAALSATGSMTGEGAQLDARLDAARLVDLADLVKRVWPGAAAEAFASRAVALSPARFNLKLAAPAGSADRIATVGTLTFDATARGSTIKGSARPDSADPSRLQVSAALDAPEAASLLRQIGLDTIPLSNSGRGRVSLSAAGDLVRGLDAKVEASLAGADLTYAGRIGLWGGDSETGGDVRLRSGNLGPLLQILGVAAPDPFAAAMPADVSVRVARTGPVWTFAGLAGKAGSAGLAGDLTLAPKAGASGRRLAGKLQFDRLSFGALAALAFGAPATPRAGALWSETRFSPALASPPETEIDLTIGRLDLTADLAASDATLRLGVTPGAVSLSDLRLAVGGGSAAGSIVLRRDGQAGSVSGRLNLTGLAIDRPFLIARLGGEMEFTATGASAAALVAGLAGSGTIDLADVRIPAADPDAVDRVVSMAERDAIVAAEPEVRSALGLEFARAPLSLGTRSFEASLASGALRLKPTGAGPAALTASLDLRTLVIEQRATVTARAPPRDWNEAQPQASVIWKGQLANPVRSIDAASLGNALSTRAIARETARVQAFEADIRERAAFNRRIKGLQYLRQREREVAVYEAEQAKLAAEQAKREAEEERRRALEAARLEREQHVRELAEQARLERERRAAEAAAQQRPIAPPPAMLAPGAIDPSASGRY